MLGLTFRILFINSDRILLGLFLFFTILSAITIGYLYAGKSWCHYFCPMAPVQMVYTGPRGLLGSSDAHQGQTLAPTQSMCRMIDSTGAEKSACVSCKAPCIDTDAEGTYWEELKKPGRRMVQYGYLGIVFAFYFYYFLYAGNWDYYFSGAWTHEEHQLGTLFDPGFYLFEQVLPIPKLAAVPLTFAFFIGIAYWICSGLEKGYRAYRLRLNKPVSREQAQHIIFTFSTVLSFWIFYGFGGRPNLNLLPDAIILMFNTVVVLVGSLWLDRTLDRSAEQYQRESLAPSMRRQLNQLNINVSEFLGDRTLNELKPDELYTLTKVLPGFTAQHRLQVYRGVLREALEQRTFNFGNSLTAFKSLRQELGILDEQHWLLLDKLQLEFPALFNQISHHPRNLEPTVLLNKDPNRLRERTVLRPRPDAKTSFSEP